MPSCSAEKKARLQLREEDVFFAAAASAAAASKAMMELLSE